MFNKPEHYHSLSLRLSEVLDDIGVNERMVKKRRRSALLQETLLSLSSGWSIYIFGSTSEGTTTLGLHSDLDILIPRPDCNVIQDYAEWKPGLTNLLMIQDDETSPGYCQLQLIRPDMPLPVTDVLDRHCFRDARSRILLKNTAYDDMSLKFSTFHHNPTRSFKNGPARSLDDQDLVVAVSCESWPTEARDWSRRNLGIWPTEDMKRYAENSGCFVVPVGSKVSQMEQLEWRISTSKAERCLMFKLNITQIRCFVLLKMILKSYLQHPVSSYMCKTVLLRCIEKTQYNWWQENNLLTCLTMCLQALYSSVLHESCPHYFIPGNNLMAGQFSPRMKDKLLESLDYLLNSQGDVLYGIHIDHLGDRLKIKMNPLHQSVQSANLPSANDIRLCISGQIVLNVANKLGTWAHYTLLKKDYQIRSLISICEKVMSAVLNFSILNTNGTNIDRKAVQILIPTICSSIGSILASNNIGTNHSVSLEAFNCLSAGLDGNVSSGRLKLASVLYCAGDMFRAESILRETERFFAHLDSVQPICTCNVCPLRKTKGEYSRICDIQNEKAISIACAFCVNFCPAEMNCIPYELQYELFRSTSEEQLHRHVSDYWMEMAVVDSLPFLYFLQYKTYGNLQKRIDQQIALEHLALTINSDEDFGHRETALNLLGQCMKQENRLNDALVCYTRSLNVRGRNNAARLHLCILLADMQKNI